MIELWVLKGDLLRALLLLLAHLVPTYVIDMLIYGDIKDGGHPYLTGLAIVGGIYFLGLQVCACETPRAWVCLHVCASARLFACVRVCV